MQQLCEAAWGVTARSVGTEDIGTALQVVFMREGDKFESPPRHFVTPLLLQPVEVPPLVRAAVPREVGGQGQCRLFCNLRNSRHFAIARQREI